MHTPLTTRFFLFLGIIILSALPLAAKESTTDIQLWYNRLRDAVYNHDTGEGTATLYYHQAIDTVNASSLSEYRSLYWKARIEYLFGRVKQDFQKKKEAGVHYEQALEHIESALHTRDFSEGYRLKSEIISQLCYVKGFGYSLVHGPDVVPLAEKALELDPTNGKAAVILGFSKVYLPGIYGGNPKKGIELLKQALELNGIEKDDTFNIYSSIGIAYDKLKNREKALYWLEKSLRIYPGNRFVNRDYNKIKAQ